MTYDNDEKAYRNAEKAYATKLHNALKANDVTLVKSIGQEIIRALPYTYRDIFDEVIRDTDSELAKKLQPMDYVTFMYDLEDASDEYAEFNDDPKLYDIDGNVAEEEDLDDDYGPTGIANPAEYMNNKEEEEE